MSCIFRIKDAFIFILLLTSFDSFSQIRGEFDLNPIYPGRRNKVIFNSGESSITKNLSIEENLFTSNNNKYACINKSVHKEDSLAEFEIFDTVGNSKIKIIAPNLDRGCVSDDGKLAVFGSFFSTSIMLPTRVYLFNSNGELKFSSNENLGFQINFIFTRYGGNMVLFYDSLSYNLINKKYNLIVFDSLFNIIGSRDIKIADDEISVTLIEINEVDKYILLQKNYLSNRAGEIFRIRYDGTLIN